MIPEDILAICGAMNRPYAACVMFIFQSFLTSNNLKDVLISNSVILRVDDEISLSWGTLRVNTLWPSDAIWRQVSESTLAQVMACTNVDLSSKRYSGIHMRTVSKEIPQPSLTKISWKITYLQIYQKSSRDQWVKMILSRQTSPASMATLAQRQHWSASSRSAAVVAPTLVFGCLRCCGMSAFCRSATVGIS